MKTLALLVAAVWMVVPRVAFAEAPEGRTEIAVFAGVSLLDVKGESSPPIPILGRDTPPPGVPIPPSVVYRQLASLGGSALLGFKVGRYVADRAEIELTLTAAPSHDLRRESFFVCRPELPCPLAGAPGRRAPIFQDRSKIPAYHYDLNLTYDLARGEVRPFLTFGLGGVSYDAPERGATDFAFNVGAGAKLYFGKRVGARIEVDDHVVPHHFLTHRVEHDVQVRGGLVFRP